MSATLMQLTSGHSLSLHSDYYYHLYQTKKHFKGGKGGEWHLSHSCAEISQVTS